MLPISLRRPVGIAVIALTFATVACGGDDDSTGPNEPPADLSGTYALTGLRTLGNLGGGGNGLPVTFVDGGGSTLTFRSGQLLLNADATYALAVEAQFNDTEVTLEDEGTYQVTGAVIAFSPTSDPARMKDGTIDGSAITAETQFGGIPFEIDLEK